MNFKKIENLAAIAIVIGFFLPWFSMGIVSFSGYDLPNLGNFANAFREDPGEFNAYWLVYIVPAGAVLALFADFQGNDAKMIYVISGIINVSLFLYALAETGGDAFSVGVWITALASVIMVMSALGIIKPSESTTSD